MSPTLKVNITKDLDRAIGKAARGRQTSKAEWVRATLERALAAESVAGDPLARRDRLKSSTSDIEQALDDLESDRK